MKPRKPLRKISLKREKMLKELNGKHFLGFNSTIARKPCNAITAEIKSKEMIFPNSNTKGRTSAPRHVRKISFLRNHGPINKQSTKQKARLRKLAAIRMKWWKQSEATGEELICQICGEPIRTFEDLASDHIIPGNPRDDSESNLQPANQFCNLLKGSRRNFKIVRGDRNWKLKHGLL